MSVADDRPVSGISFAEGKVVIAGALLLEAASRVNGQGSAALAMCLVVSVSLGDVFFSES